MAAASAVSLALSAVARMDRTEMRIKVEGTDGRESTRKRCLLKSVDGGVGAGCLHYWLVINEVSMLRRFAGQMNAIKLCSHPLPSPPSNGFGQMDAGAIGEGGDWG
jgi:hypothetical protein